MRAIQRLRALEVFTGVSEGQYDVVYEYDAQERIVSESLTGAIERHTVYTYDAEDNIATETIEENGRTTTKTYSYDPVTKNVTKVAVSVA